MTKEFFKDLIDTRGVENLVVIIVSDHRRIHILPNEHQNGKIAFNYQKGYIEIKEFIAERNVVSVVPMSVVTGLIFKNLSPATPLADVTT